MHNLGVGGLWSCSQLPRLATQQHAVSSVVSQWDRGPNSDVERSIAKLVTAGNYMG